MLKLIISIIILLLLSGLFSATETAFTSVNRIRLKNMAASGDKKAKRALELTDKYDKLLSTILVGNNLVNIAITSLATALCIKLFPDYGVAIATAATTIVVLIFGEISPKTIAKESSESFSKGLAPFIRFFMIILTPVNFIFSLWRKLILKIIKVEDNDAITEGELITIVEEAETEGSIGEEQSELIQNAIEFSELMAKDVLTPRVDVVAIENGTELSEIEETFSSTGFSRLPIYEEDLDNIVGVLNQKDYHNYIKGKLNSIESFVKPVIYVAETIKISQLLKRLQAAKTHIAVVIDEYGGTQGIVTMEDIIEELVGEIYDEFDAKKADDVTDLGGGTYRVQSSANLEKLFDYFEIGNHEEIDATTLNGWININLDRLPKVGDNFETTIGQKTLKINVTKADNRKSLEALVTVKDAETSE